MITNGKKKKAKWLPIGESGQMYMGSLVFFSQIWNYIKGLTKTFWTFQNRPEIPQQIQLNLESIRLQPL